jgi:hypothetical protein
LSREHVGCGFRRVEELLKDALIQYPTRTEDPPYLVVTFVRLQVLALIAGAGTGGIRLDGDAPDPMFAIVIP